MIGAVAVFGTFALFLWIALRSRRAGVLMCVFLAPWNGLDADFGLRISAYQLAVAALLAVVALRALRPGYATPRIAAGGGLALFALFAIGWSLVQIAFIPDASFASGASRAPVFRAIAQIVVFLFTLVPVALIAWTMRSPDDLRAVLRVFLASLTVSAALGWLQLALWYGTGNNPFVVGAVSAALGGDSSVLRQGLFGFTDLTIYRMNALAGEPRELGASLAVGMIVIQALALTQRRLPAAGLAALWLLFLVSTLATFSTSAVLLWGLGSAALAVAVVALRIPVQRSRGQIAATLLGVTALVTLAVGLAEARGIPVISLAAERTIERLDEGGAVEDFDLAILDFFRQEPLATVLGTGLGNAHLYAAPFMLVEFQSYSEGQVFAAKQQYLRIVSEVGIAGLLLFAGWFAALIYAATRATRTVAGFGAAAPIGAAILVVFMASGAIGPIFWVMSGALAAFCAVAARQRTASGRAVERNGIEPLTSTMPS